MLACTFVVLAVTGLPLRFADAAPAAALYRALGGLAGARAAHRAAGLALGVVALVHLGYAAVLLVRARFDVRRAWPLVPRRTDLHEWWQAALHDLGLRSEPPAYGRHRFREKIHYWAVAWGVPVMILSGVVLWFPVALGNHLPDAAIGAAFLAHGDEALVAVTVVVVWHLYQVHVAPRPHHRFMTWIDGRVTRGYQAAEHPGEER
jgi:cytochrome b subunit of formate dehydrogenase